MFVLCWSDRVGLCHDPAMGRHCAEHATAGDARWLTVAELARAVHGDRSDLELGRRPDLIARPEPAEQVVLRSVDYFPAPVRIDLSAFRHPQNTELFTHQRPVSAEG
jgi:hypothetical protein